MRKLNSRIYRFTSIFGEAWLVGHYLLPKLRALGGERYEVVLDLACGESPFRELFSDVGQYLRVDRSSMDPEVIDGDMRAIPIVDSSVDLVILSQALSDVPVPAMVLNELARVLVGGGRVIVFESMSYPEHDMPCDYYRLMPSGLNWLATEAGFKVEECTYLGGLFTRFASLWADFVMGKLKQHWLTRPFAAPGIAAGNIICFVLDRLMTRRNLASDYLAVLRIESDREANEGV
jgi:SAM-dependent methyltransferase